MVKVKFVEVENQQIKASTGFFAQFNPEQMTITENCTEVQATNSIMNSKDESNAAIQKNARAKNAKNAVTLSMNLLFNTLTSFNEKTYNDVREAIRQFHQFTIYEDKAAKSVGVIFGSVTIVGFITSMSTTYTAFDTEGKALRATVDITVEGSHYGEQKAVDLKNERTIHQTQSTFAQSLKAYGDAVDWKKSAKANNVEDPLKK